jgi:hypothetical protein
MVAHLRFPHAASALARLAEHWREALTLLLCLVVASLIARSFVGSSTSPYGTCYGSTGRSIPCELSLKRR